MGPIHEFSVTVLDATHERVAETPRHNSLPGGIVALPPRHNAVYLFAFIPFILSIPPRSRGQLTKKVHHKFS
jgi:hypothetical protein